MVSPVPHFPPFFSCVLVCVFLSLPICLFTCLGCDFVSCFVSLDLASFSYLWYFFLLLVAFVYLVGLLHPVLSFLASSHTLSHHCSKVRIYILYILLWQIYEQEGHTFRHNAMLFKSIFFVSVLLQYEVKMKNMTHESARFEEGNDLS